MTHIGDLGYLAIAGAGVAAGAINAIVGSGSLITFPALVALGVPPLVANVSNNVGISVGNVGAIHGFRRELQEQPERVRTVAPWSLLGGATGAVLLLIRPSSFRAIVPWLILLAVVLVIVQPWLARRLQARRDAVPSKGVLMRIGVFATGVYGGYFGAAQGVILIAVFAVAYNDTMLRANALKNFAAGVVNITAAVLFAIFAPVSWTIAATLGVSSVIGSQVGSSIGRRMPAEVLRAIIVVGGLAAALHLLL